MSFKLSRLNDDDSDVKMNFTQFFSIEHDFQKWHDEIISLKMSNNV